MNGVINNPFALSRRFAHKKAHFGVCGSIACYKMIELLRAFRKIDISVSATLTASAKKFLSPLLFKSLGAERVYDDLFDDADAFAHLEPAHEGGVFLVSPATANIIAKMAGGIADDALSCQLLAFDNPVLVAPAMNPRMYKNPATQDNINTLVSRGATLIPPETGEAACGDQGEGKLAALDAIFLAVLKALSPQDFAGKKVMVTMGPTREYWDGVRFFGNPSSGIMGAALATAAWLRGASVTAIVGPGVDIYLPPAIRSIPVVSASEMAGEARKIWSETDCGMFVAAVCDFVPESTTDIKNSKVPKRNAPVAIKISPSIDVLGSLSSQKTATQKILGFAAQIVENNADLVPLAKAKLLNKNMDLIAANRVNREGGAFGAEETAIVAIDKNGNSEEWTPRAKADVAWELCSWLLRI